MTDEPSPVPVGTIVAFAGNVDLIWLDEQGWLYCDGAELRQTDHPALYAAIGGNYGAGHNSFRLPDLRGRFTRGVDLGAGRDPYVEARTPSAPGGLAGNNPGSLQGYYTSLPATTFKAADDGEHAHDVAHLPTENEGLATEGSHYGIWPDNTRQIRDAGAHGHTVTDGGDAETRPINKYVYFIIKYSQ
ncbi:microcystin-dependent protein [Micromonospora pisi]|uniref:Microcystin-dependent protein n=1 Tax=Micromonospora pisi TaxID=589240 RepID=A0A495JX25_9ACTN|nr:tail fiber protein [Micromonospora pisi]RKR92912.1 microcystin-dependent protein [Micromonospora pisi]